jgi:hypothetical protein
LPFGNPGGGGVADRDKGVEDGRGAFRNGVGGVLKLQKGLAVGAAGADELLEEKRVLGRGNGRGGGRGKGRTVWVLTIEHTMQARMLREEDMTEIRRRIAWPDGEVLRLRGGARFAELLLRYFLSVRSVWRVTCLKHYRA